jgi:hypothetical protein
MVVTIGMILAIEPLSENKIAKLPTNKNSTTHIVLFFYLLISKKVEE